MRGCEEGVRTREGVRGEKGAKGERVCEGGTRALSAPSCGPFCLTTKTPYYEDESILEFHELYTSRIQLDLQKYNTTCSVGV